MNKFAKKFIAFYAISSILVVALVFAGLDNILTCFAVWATIMIVAACIYIKFSKKE
jgi:hypothetical protein